MNLLLLIISSVLTVDVFQSEQNNPLKPIGGYSTTYVYPNGEPAFFNTVIDLSYLHDINTKQLPKDLTNISSL